MYLSRLCHACTLGAPIERYGFHRLQDAPDSSMGWTGMVIVLCCEKLTTFEGPQAPEPTRTATTVPTTSEPYAEDARKDLIHAEKMCDAKIAAAQGEFKSALLEIIQRIEALEQQPTLAKNITALQSRMEQLELDPTSASITSATQHTTVQAEPSNRAVCQAGCSPEIVAGNNGLELTACCGDIFFHSQKCSVDPCVIHADLAVVKSKLGL